VYNRDERFLSGKTNQLRNEMKKALFYLLLATAAASLCGCTPMLFSEYTGHDATSYLGTWRLGPGTMAEREHGGGLFTSGLAVPVYRGWPEREYQVLGSLRFDDPNKSWGYDEGLLKDAASEAKKHGADAIIIRQGAEFGIFQIAGGGSDPRSVLFSSQTTALAIRWLSQQEIDERHRLVDDYLNRLAVQVFKDNPKVAANRTIAELVITYLFINGYDLRSADLWDRFAETVKRLVSDTPANPAGEWIFKTTVSSEGISGGDEKNFLGLARISADVENLTIVSSGGKVELNFNGTLAKGRLTGQLGIGSVSAKCEGAATPDKISISFQSPTPDGTVSGNIVLQRLTLKPNDDEKAKPDPAARGN